MKRLLAGGLERIYAVCRASRAGEVGPQHQPEFTMVEWYRAWAGLEEVLGDTEELVAAAALAVRGTTRLERPGESADARRVDVAPPWRRMTVAEAMERWAGVAIRGGEEPGALRERLAMAGIDPGGATAWDDLFYTAFVDRVEPRLATEPAPVVLVDWPVELAALARPISDRGDVVERFEAYVAGVELCNAFGELTDPEEQRARFAEDLRQRAARGKAVPPVDQRFLAALAEGIPPSAGNALGLDRLVMLVTGKSDLRQVTWFTADEL
jgi:lysyl-tRNA synthetase class 2